MECRRATSFSQLLAVLSVVLLTSWSSFSHARRAVVEVSAVVANIEQEFPVHGYSSFSLQKENIVDGGLSVRAAAEFETSDSQKVGGRKMIYKSEQLEEMKTEASFALIHGTGNTNKKEEEAERLKENSTAFTLDYGSPRAHPPRNN